MWTEERDPLSGLLSGPQFTRWRRPAAIGAGVRGIARYLLAEHIVLQSIPCRFSQQFAVPALVRPRTMDNLDRGERICSHHLPDIIPINVPYCGINKAVRDLSALPIRWQTQ